MSQNIEIQISESILEEQHDALRKAVNTLLGYVRPEYREWLRFNGEPIVIESPKGRELGWFRQSFVGTYREKKIIMLTPRLFDLPIPQQRMGIEEEIVHMIDAYTGFSKSWEFRQAVDSDIEELSTKTLFAVSRIWNGLIKAMPTGDLYSSREEEGTLYTEA